MPKLKNNEAWVNGLRTAIRSSTAKGWTVREHRGLARLEVRTGNGMRSAQLMKNNIPFSYSSQNMGDIITRVRNIYVEMANNGGDFDTAVAVCAGLAPKLTYSHDWGGAKDDFEKYKKEMAVIEVDDELAIKTCRMYNYKYTVITPNDFVIPPKNDNISKD